MSEIQNESLAATAATCCNVVELRQYTLRPGMRDTLISLFEREFVASQEALGITLIGLFRDLDNPDRFVWLRGFHDMSTRTDALAKFYGGPVWKAHREAANATMMDSDNVLLLRPVIWSKDSSLSKTPRVAESNVRSSPGLVSATLYYLNKIDGGFPDYFTKSIAPVVATAGARIVGAYVSETAANNFPRLPVRDGERVFVWLAEFDSPAAFSRYKATLAAMPAWRNMSKTLQSYRHREETLRLLPTARSRLPQLPESRLHGVSAPAPLAASPEYAGGGKDFNFLIGRWSIGN